MWRWLKKLWNDDGPFVADPTAKVAAAHARAAPLTATERRELQNGTLVLKNGCPFRPHPTGNTELDPVTGREIPKQSEKG